MGGWPSADRIQSSYSASRASRSSGVTPGSSDTTSSPADLDHPDNPRTVNDLIIEHPELRSRDSCRFLLQRVKGNPLHVPEVLRADMEFEAPGEPRRLASAGETRICDDLT